MAATSPLLDVTLGRVRAGWKTKLSVEISALIKPGITLVPRESYWGMFALELQGSVVVVCHPSLLAVLSPLAHDNLLDMTLLLRILDDHQPDPIGAATIAYTDIGALKDSSGANSARLANAQEVDEVMSSCTESEQDESGLANLSVLFATHSADGEASAIAGYEAWQMDIAQMGVLAIPNQRGNGLAFTAAQAAAHSALAEELVPQWRCRIGNQSSYRLGQRLGFHEVGRQLAIDITRTN